MLSVIKLNVVVLSVIVLNVVAPFNQLLKRINCPVLDKCDAGLSTKHVLLALAPWLECLKESRATLSVDLSLFL